MSADAPERYGSSGRGKGRDEFDGPLFVRLWFWLSNSRQHLKDSAYYSLGRAAEMLLLGNIPSGWLISLATQDRRSRFLL